MFYLKYKYFLKDNNVFHPTLNPEGINSDHDIT